MHALDSSAEAITHAIWIGADELPASNGDTIWKHIADDALNQLTICQSMDIRELYWCYSCIFKSCQFYLISSSNHQFSCCEYILAGGRTQAKPRSALE